tara:strand:- start:3653 stop:4051 length:399 start_codon:yes stop_codon:yes gene_type:complete
MPSIRKRIGYLPSLNIHEIIANIAKNEKLSQSKVVGILVEEALIARGVFDQQNTHCLIDKSSYINDTNINNSALKFSDLDELISDKGITYNKKKYTQKSNNSLSESIETDNEDLFEQFKQFILFQKMKEENK